MKRLYDRHHILSSARGGRKRGNLVTIPVTFHRAYHTLFQDLTLEEAHRFLEIVMQPGFSWTNGDLYHLRNYIKGSK